MKILDTMTIFDTGVPYEGRLISATKVNSSGLYLCSYRWLYGTHEVYLHRKT